MKLLTIIALPFAACLALALRAPSPTSASAACVNVLPHEPVVLYEVAGWSLGGPIDLELALYGDGSARLSSATANGGQGKAQTAVVPAQTATGLLAALTANGAFVLCDEPSFTTDTPLSTLTVLRPKTDAQAHTFSWWAGVNEYEPIEQRLQGFVQTTFPNF